MSPATQAAPQPHLDPDLPAEQRINHLVSQLTLPEKISQLNHQSPAIERLGVPAYNWWSEACHGVGRNGRATVFPQVIGLGATWNRALVRRLAGVIADEARAKHHHAAAAGRRGQYQGLTFWTPNINIFRDPRWGRGQETFGEDPFLTGELGTAMVQGLQGDDPRYLKVAACAKHFAVHSGPEQARHGFDARPTPKDFTESYLPAFEKLVRAGVEAVMGAYNRTFGEPCCGSRLLLVDILRQRWGFRGHVVSDCWAIDDFHRHHNVTRNMAESAALALRMGCDLSCGCAYDDLVVAVRDGLVTEAEVDTSLRRLLATRIKLGQFDPPERVPFARTPVSVIDSEAHRAEARRAAVESIVLLKNNGVLPLRRNHESVLVTGPTAASVPALLGNYYGISGRLVTILEGITAGVAEECRVVYRMGCPLSSPMAPGVNYTYPTAAENEITIAVLGLDNTLEGEEGDSVASPEGGDRGPIELPAVQREFLVELRKHARKLVVVLTGGGAIAAPEVQELADAVLLAWYPGCEGGHAVADVLFGDAAPSGRLPVTVPRSTEDLPAFADYGMKGRTYRFATVAPLYPFGFGLGYTRVGYGALRLGTNTLAKDGELSVTATLTHHGDRTAAETVQCYIVPPQSWPDAPRATLAAFAKVALAPHGTQDVRFQLPASAFTQFDAEGRPCHAPGRYRIVVGSCSPGPRGLELGAPAPAEAEVTLT